MMRLDRLNTWLTILGWILGVALILYGIWRSVIDDKRPALLVTSAVVLAGPVEDVLKALVRRRRPIAPEDPEVRFVDLTTSIGFLLLLTVAISLM